MPGQLAPVAGSIALLEHVGSYRAYDYAVGLISEMPENQVRRDAIWACALEGATDALAFSVAVAAYGTRRF